MRKICFKCNQEKDISCFYKHRGMKDGHLNKCKECSKKDVKENYRKNIDYYKEYDQIRKKYIKEQTKKYAIKHPDKIKNLKKKWEKNNRDGKLKRKPCQICNEEKVEGHHCSYYFPKIVIWLCKEHHEKVHWWLRFWRRRYKLG